jgi:endonuclease YncB( thermonuclease family)
MERSRILLIFAAVLGLGAGPAEPLHVRVVGVHDGDTLTALTDDKRQLKVRLHGIDAPDLGQPFGQASKQALSDLVFGKQVTLHTTGTDRYKRTLAHVFRADGRSLEEALLDAGLALQIVFPPNVSLAACFHAAEERARAAGRGLWHEGPLAVSRLRGGEQGFRLLQGRVTRVARARSSWWIEIDGRVSLRVDRSDWKYFGPGMPESLRGQMLEARGWLTWRRETAQQQDPHPPWSLRIRHPLALSVRTPP